MSGGFVILRILQNDKQQGVRNTKEGTRTGMVRVWKVESSDPLPLYHSLQPIRY